MMDNPENADGTRKELLKSFSHIFEEQRSGDIIRSVVKHIEQDEPIADLLQSPTGSFSTIFSPFHGKQIYPVQLANPALRKSSHPNLLRFFDLAGEIESFTDTLSLQGEEPSEEQKQVLLPLLKEFITLIPTVETFTSWLSKP